MPTGEDLIIPGLGLAGEIFGAVSQGTQNRKQRKWNERMMWKERVWALEDWNRQNEYNSPAAQMARLKAAGLNPNLVYGHGADAQSQAMPRSVQSKSYEGRAARLDLGGPAMMYLSQQLLQKDIELKELQKPVVAQDAALRAAQVLQTLQGVESSKYDLGMRQRLADNIMETAQAHLESIRTGIESTEAGTLKTRIETGIAIDRNDREAAQTASNIKEATERILKSQKERGLIDWTIPEIMERTELIELEEKMKQKDLELKEKGLQPGDNIWWRRVTEFIEDIKARARLKRGQRIKSGGKTKSGLEYKRY